MFARKLLCGPGAILRHQVRTRYGGATIDLSNGEKMPILGLGTFQINDEESVERTLTAAIDAGYRHIDSAFTHTGERFIGKALKKIFESGKVKREDLFITTKLPMNGLGIFDVEDFMKKSLKHLQLDYVDLYLISTPVATMRTETDEEIVPMKDGRAVMYRHVELEETWSALESLVHNELTKSIGVANFNSKQLTWVYHKAAIKPVNLQVECHAYLPQLELQQLCREFNIAMTAYAPLGSPAFPEFVRDYIGKKDYNKPKLLDDERLKPIAEKYQRTPAQILLRYLVQRGIAVIPKSINPDRLKENAQICDFVLLPADMALLESMADGTRYFTLDFWPGFREHPEYPFKIPY